MPKRELSKCREWERERRDRLNTSFKNLSQILPAYDPCVTLTKAEILQKARNYIEELQNKNKQLQLGNVTENDKQSNIQILEERIKKLLIRVEQLVKLLKDAGITVPTELDLGKNYSKPKLWSNKITQEQAESIAEKIKNLKNGEKLIVQKNSITVKKRDKSQKSKTKIHKNIISRKVQNENLRTVDSQQAKKRKIEKLSQTSTQQNIRTTSLPLISLNGISDTKKSLRNCSNVTPASVVTANMNLSNRTSLVKTSSLLSTPIMATGLNNHSSLSSLGPGTLILANGNTIQIQPAIISTVLNPPQNPTLLLIDNNPKLSNKELVPPVIASNKLCPADNNKIIGDKYPKIVPKLDITRTTTVNKIPIPALTSKQNTHKPIKILNNKSIKSNKIIKRDLNKVKSKENRKISLIQIKKIRLQNKKNKNTLNSTSKNRKIENIAGKSKKSESASEVGAKNIVENQENKTETENVQKKPSTSSYSVDSLCKSAPVENKDPQKESVPSNTDSDTITQNVNPNETVLTDKNTNQIPVKEDKNVEISKEVKNNKIPDTTKKITETKSDTIETKVTSLATVPNTTSVILTTSEKPTTISTTNSKLIPVESNVVTSAESTKQTESTLSLTLPNTDFSSDIFASLHVPHGSQPESISPTAAFLLAFPLVSTLTGGKISENVDDENSDSQQGTPTLLQIGNIENPAGNPNKSTADTSHLLDNIPNLFSQNDSKNSRHTVKKQSTDFIQNDCGENKNRTPTKEPSTNSVKNVKEKVANTSFDLLNNTNCLFSDIPLFPTSSSVSNNIFNYEHIPVTYTMPKLPEMFPLSSTSTTGGNNHKEIKSKNETVLPLPNLTFTPNEFLPVSSNTNYSLDKLSHSEIVSSSQNIVTTSANNNITVQSNISVADLQLINSNNEYSNKINNFNKKPSSNNQNWKVSSGNDTLLCQNVFNTNYNTTIGELKQPTRSNNEKSAEKSYSHLPAINTFSNIDKSAMLQKPPVNWMTTPDNKKDVVKDYQNTSYTKTNFSIDNSEKMFNNDPYYQNIDPINFNVHKKSMMNHNFTPMFSSSSYSARSQTNNNNNNNQYSWSSTKLSSLNDNLHLGLQTPSTLPMLVGDLALNPTSSQSKYDSKDFECDKKVITTTKDNNFASKDIIKYKNKHCSETQTNNSFFSVSQLVEHNKHDQTTTSQVRSQTSNNQNQRKSVPQNRPNKLNNNSVQRQSKRIPPKANEDVNSSKTQSTTNESFSCAKSTLFQDLPTFSLPQLELYENSNVSRDIDWAKPQDTAPQSSFINKNMYKNCSSTYSAEALIGGNNLQNNNTSNFQTKNPIYSNAQQYMSHSTPKRMQMASTQPYESIGPPFYSTPVQETTYVTNYYSQTSNTFTYTTSSTLYQPSSLMTTSANFMNTSGLIPDIETDFNTQTTNNNIDISSSSTTTNRPSTHCSKSTKTDARTTINSSLHTNPKSQTSTYASHATKRSLVKRKQTIATEPTNNLPGFSDLGFLSLSSMNSPMLSDDPFHSHTNYFSTNTSQMYSTGTSQNHAMYPKRINQQNHEYSSCNLLPSLPSAPFTRNNILPHTQNAVASPSNSGGNALTNFNLSTIFPEINKPFVSGLYDNSTFRSGNNLSTTSSQQTYGDYSNV